MKELSFIYIFIKMKWINLYCYACIRICTVYDLYLLDICIFIFVGYEVLIKNVYIFVIVCSSG